MTAIIEIDTLTAGGLRTALGDLAEVYDSYDALGVRPGRQSPTPTIVVGPSIDNELALEFAESTRRADPTCGVILVRRRTDAGLLAAALRAGVREVVAERDLPGMVEAVRRSDQVTRALRQTAGGTSEDEGGESHEPGRLISIWSPKGGCGKTTLAVNVAVSLASRGHSVLLIDLDLAFGDVAISMGLRPEHGFEEVVAMGEMLDRAALRGLLLEHHTGVQVLAPPTDPEMTERIDTALVARILQIARNAFDYVIVDTSPALDERNIHVMESSDGVLLLTTLDIPSLKNLRVGIDTLRLISFPTERMHIVLNRADSKVGLNADEVSKSLGVAVASKIPSSREVPTTTNRGVSIVAESPRHAVSQAINELVSAVVVSPEHASARRGSLRLWRRA